MPGISPSVIVHKLDASPNFKLVQQRRRGYSTEKSKATAKEVKKLCNVGFVNGVQYTTWLSNVVLVKKSNGKWRMCIDFTDLNKAYPKDNYPLPRIDMLVDSTSSHELLSFMDAFLRYNQISMHEYDQEEMAFMTYKDLYCYQVMPFELKNARATYQRLMNRMFREQIGRNMEV